MRAPRHIALLAAATLMAAGATTVVASAAAPAIPPPVEGVAPTTWAAVPVERRLQPWLAEELARGGTAALRVMVSGETASAAQAAAQAVGLTVQQTWEQLGIVVAAGSPDAIRAVVTQPGVTAVEGDQPLKYTLDSAHRATRSDQALAELTGPGGVRLDGRGITIAVIDSGIDGTHPMFVRAGKSKVVRNLENVCTIASASSDTCYQAEPTNDTDTNSGGGHGTHVAGIAAGYEVTTASPAGVKLRGAAPEAKLVGLSVGAGLSVINAVSAMNWVVEHQRKPCVSADPAMQAGPLDPECPPIRVTNHSYGPVNTTNQDNTFSPDSAAVRAQRTLVSKGVTVVWAAGNDGGDGSVALTNPPGMDPTPGVLMVSSYNDVQSGSRDGAPSSFSSRGKRGSPDSYPDISAPGERITSACRRTLAVCSGSPSYDDGNYQTISGTSMSTPYIAGVVAQLVQADPAQTPAMIEDVLEDTAHAFTAGGAYEADPLNADSSTSFDKGHGLVDVYAALTRSLSPPSASPSPSASSAASTSATPSATPSASGATATPSSSSPSSPPPSSSSSSSSPSATQSSSSAAACPTASLRVNTAVINATGLASVSAFGVRPGDTVDVQGYSQDHALTRSFANDQTPRDRTGVADGNGMVTFNDLRLSSNTRLRAQVRGCSFGDSAVVSVRTLLTMAVRKTGPRSYLLTGRALPAREGGLVVSLYRIVGASCAAGVEPRNCPGETLIGQARADAVSGEYSMRTSFPASLAGKRVNLVLKTGSDGQNAPGRSNVRNLLVLS